MPEKGLQSEKEKERERERRGRQAARSGRSRLTAANTRNNFVRHPSIRERERETRDVLENTSVARIASSSPARALPPFSRSTFSSSASLRLFRAIKLSTRSASPVFAKNPVRDPRASGPVAGGWGGGERSTRREVISVFRHASISIDRVRPR